MTLSEGRFHFVEAGSGPVLLLIHGLLGSSYCWRRNVVGLASSCRVIAIDLPGMGKSDPFTDRAAGVSRLADYLVEFMAAVGITTAAVLGSSWGGAIALSLAARYPQSVDALILHAPVTPWFMPSTRQSWLLKPPVAAPIAWTLSRLRPQSYRRFIAAMYGHPALLNDETVLGYAADLQRPGTGSVITGYMRHWRRELSKLGDELKRLHTPALLVWGEKDNIIPVRSAKTLQKHLAGAKLKIIPGAGHLAFEESPERFNEVVLSFMTAAGAKAGSR